jgi:hypothetical protein
MHALLSLSLVQGWSHALSFSLVKLGSQDAPVAPLLMLAVKYEPKPTWSPSHNTGTLHRARQAVQHCSIKKNDCMHCSSLSVNLTRRTSNLSSYMQRQQRREGDGRRKFSSRPNSPKTRLFIGVSACTLHIFWSKLAACMGVALHVFTPSFPFCICILAAADVQCVHDGHRHGRSCAATAGNRHSLL